jgi:predicted component of type VI protein secretion system
MLVTPASQQQFAERTDALVHALPGRYQPYFWGVSRDVEYDAAALQEGILRVRMLDAVMRNGCHVAIDEDARLELPLSLNGGQSTVVRVALDEEAEHSRRFVPCSDGAPIVLGEDGIEIPLAKPRLVLYDGRSSQPARAGTSFPLCEVRRESGAYRLTGFLPPALRVAPSSALGKRCGPIPRALRAEASAVRDRGRLNAVAVALPAFEVVLAGDPHPFTLYVELCRLAGAAAALRDDAIPAFPQYDHDAAHTAFDSVLRYVLKEAGESGAFRRFTFERDGSGFRLGPDPGWTEAISPDSGLELVMTIESEDPQAERWGENCLIATSSMAGTLLGRRLLGWARRRVMPGPALPSGANLHHFRITPNAGATKPDEELVVFGHFGGIEPSALYLYVHETPAGAR